MTYGCSVARLVAQGVVARISAAAESIGLPAFIGEDGVKRSIDEAYEEYGRQQNSEAWRVFLHGTEGERRQFREECDAALDAMAREHDDQFPTAS